jgi:hypothetical protein
MSPAAKRIDVKHDPAVVGDRVDGATRERRAAAASFLAVRCDFR